MILHEGTEHLKKNLFLERVAALGAQLRAEVPATMPGVRDSAKRKFSFEARFARLV